MRGLYEQQWQEAMAGAAIQPSERLWDNIVNDLDNTRGRHNWVTILLIAATVTVAFAFPLTIGNSSLQNRENLENLEQSIAQQDVSNAGSKSSDSSDSSDNGLSSKEGNNNIVQNNEHAQNIASKPNSTVGDELMLANSTATEETSVRSNEATNEQVLSAPETISASSSTTIGFGMEDFALSNTLIVVDINDYYFIPYYLPSGNRADRNILASLNMGTGSLSAGNGFGGLNFESADAAYLTSDIGNGFTDNRTENPGSTYYFGLGAELPIGKRWSFLAGVGYLAQNASGTSNIILDAGNGNQPLGAYDPIVPGTIFLSDSYSYSVTNGYINVPLTFKYPIVNRKIKFRVGMGVSTDFMISHVIDSDAYGKASYDPASMDYKTVVLSGLVNFDLSYSLNNHYSVALETGIRKGITAIDNNKDYYPSSFTVGLVLFYKIR